MKGSTVKAVVLSRACRRASVTRKVELASAVERAGLGGGLAGRSRVGWSRAPAEPGRRANDMDGQHT